jgi:hypothetical protein
LIAASIKTRLSHTCSESRTEGSQLGIRHF